MPRLKRVRHRLITELVRENVETLHGVPPRSLRRTRRVRSGVLRGLGLVVAPSLLFVAISALSTGRGEQPALAPPAASSGDVSFPAPQLINPAAFPLTVQKIILDPGHGGKDPGAPTSVGLWEKDITLDVARRLRTLLAEASFDVAMTREKDVTVSLRQRAQFANAQQGDLFVSIHFNALPTRDHRGVETYYLGPTSDPDVERLAGAENRESGYSLADFRRLLEGVYVHVRQKESKQFAESVHRGLTTTLVKGNPAIKDSGVKPAPFLVLVATDMPGLLAEVSYLSNDDDARLLREPSYRDKIARALFKGIRAYADGRSQPGGKGSSS